MPVSFDDTTRQITASLEERPGSHAQFRWRKVGDTIWQNVPDNFESEASWAAGPDAAAVEVEVQLVYADGTRDEEWTRYPTAVPVNRLRIPPEAIDCEDVASRAVGGYYTWVEGNERYEGFVGNPWYP